MVRTVCLVALLALGTAASGVMSCSVVNAPGDGSPSGASGPGGGGGSGGGAPCQPPYNTLEHCGACDTPCQPDNANGASCAQGSCNYSACAAGFQDCDGDRSNGCESNQQTDAAHCGSCTTVCSTTTMQNVTGPACTAAHCDYAGCATGFADCDGNRGNGCEMSATTLQDCNGCSVACAPANATGPSCATGTCDYAQCTAGYQDCDGDRSNGCESNRLTDPDNCGGCNSPCGNGMPCSGGFCQVPTNCKQVLDLGLSVGDGMYTIDPNGGDPSDAYQAYCDMTNRGGGWTQCFSFTNTAAEELNCNNSTWFHPCVDLAMAATSGSEVMLQLRDSNQSIIYIGAGSRPSAWTYSNLTSPNTPDSQYDRSNQHPNAVSLDSGHLLSISGYDAANSGWGGSWGNGYVLTVITTPAYAANMVVTAMTYQSSSPSYDHCVNRYFQGMTPSLELMYSPSAAITTYSDAVLQAGFAFFGEMRFFIR
jgi:hypothetical protein